MTMDSFFETSPLVVELRARTSGRTVIAVAGEADMSNGGRLRHEIAALASGDSAGRVSLDLSALTFLGSAGIRALLHGRSLVERQDGQLDISAAHPNVRQVLAICGLTDLFHLPEPDPL